MIYFILLIFAKVRNNNTQIYESLYKFMGVFELRHIYGVGWDNNVRVSNDVFDPIRIPLVDVLLPVPSNYDKYLIRIWEMIICQFLLKIIG